MKTKLIDAEVICEGCGACCLKEAGGCTTGYGTGPDGRKYCFACCDQREMVNFAKADRFTAYMGPDNITTWTGGILARIKTRRITRKPCSMGGYFYYVRAVTSEGNEWWGYSPGVGCYCTLRRARS